MRLPSQCLIQGTLCVEGSVDRRIPMRAFTKTCCRAGVVGQGFRGSLGRGGGGAPRNQTSISGPRDPSGFEVAGHADKSNHSMYG